MAKETQAVVKFDKEYALQVRETMAMTIGEMGVGTFDLSRIMLPSGNGKSFEVPVPGGEPESAKSFDAIILATKSGEKSWWAAPYGSGGGATPPSCSAHGNGVGFGVRELNEAGSDVAEGIEPTEQSCDTCPWNQFGSARNGGAGKDCKDLQVLFVLLPGAFLPSILIVPPTSLKNVKKYVIGLISGAVQPHAVMTKFSLEEDKSSGGISYQKLKLSAGRKLSDDDVAQMKELAAKAKELLLSKTIDVTQEDVATA